MKSILMLMIIFSFATGFADAEEIVETEEENTATDSEKVFTLSNLTSERQIAVNTEVATWILNPGHCIQLLESHFHPSVELRMGSMPLTKNIADVTVVFHRQGLCSNEAITVSEWTNKPNCKPGNYTVRDIEKVAATKKVELVLEEQINPSEECIPLW